MYTACCSAQTTDLFKSDQQRQQQALRVHCSNIYTVVKGLILYDIHIASFIPAQQKIEAIGGQVEDMGAEHIPNELKAEVDKSVRILQQCLDHLSHDQDGTYENAIFKGALLGLVRNGQEVPKKYHGLLGEYRNMFGL